jgi:hypothetical protein
MRNMQYRGPAVRLEWGRICSPALLQAPPPTSSQFRAAAEPRSKPHEREVGMATEPAGAGA